MSDLLLNELRIHLARSDSAARKEWANQIVEQEVPIEDLLVLLHTEGRTGQRFMWLLGDICERSPDVIADCMPLLFSLRNEMPFPGMPRSISKWLLLTDVPESVAVQAISQLLKWMEDSKASIACKSYSARVLVNLVQQDRVSRSRVMKKLSPQIEHSNKSYAHRIQRLVYKLSDD